MIIGIAMVPEMTRMPGSPTIQEAGLEIVVGNCCGHEAHECPGEYEEQT
jgi:hypothetical protein